MSTIARRRSHRFARAAVALLVLGTPGCLTCATWEKLDHTPREKAVAVVLTPVTVTVDVALFAAYAWLEAGCPGLDGCHCRCR